MSVLIFSRKSQNSLKSYKSINFFLNLINSYVINSLKCKLQNFNYKSLLKKLKVITFLQNLLKS